MTDVGFVVIGRNEGARLELCIRSVLAVSRRVIYADSASTDGSVATAERLGVAVVQLPSDGRLTAARGRNATLRWILDGGPAPLPTIPPASVDGSGLDPVNEWGHDVLWWLDRMARTPRPLMEKLTLFGERTACCSNVCAECCRSWKCDSAWNGRSWKRSA